jgi:lipoyl synthase
MIKPKRKLSFFFPALRRLETSPFLVPGTCGTVAASVTGDYCHLMCKHCGGVILKNMSAARTPSALKELARRITEKGGRSILISGGADPKGMVPLLDFTRAIKEIRSELGLKVLVHTGLVSPQLADALAEAQVDLAMLDIIGDNRTVREVYHLEASVEDYEQSLKLLVDRAIPTAPHVVMGLHFGQILGEPLALEMIAEYPIRTLVLVGFRPIPKTVMAKTPPPSPGAMGEFFVLARGLFPETPVVLGCERPLGLHRQKTDLLALEAGLDGITYPGERVVQRAGDLAMDISYHADCCALVKHND